MMQPLDSAPLAVLTLRNTCNTGETGAKGPLRVLIRNVRQHCSIKRFPLGAALLWGDAAQADRQDSNGANATTSSQVCRFRADVPLACNLQVMIGEAKEKIRFRGCLENCAQVRSTQLAGRP